MKKWFAAAVVFCLVALVAAQAGEKTAKVEGTWIGVSGISDGKKLPDGLLDKIMLTVVFKEGKYSVLAEGKEVETGSYKTDASKKTLDLTISKGKDEGKTQLGIYKLDGDSLSVAFGAAGSKNRPKNFDGGPDIEVTVMKRKK